MTKYDDRRSNVFLLLWTFAVIATTASFLFYLAVRVESIEKGYDLGDSYAKIARLREVERVLELEQAAHNTPERIDMVGRTLFLMEEPAGERIFSAGNDPSVASDGDDPDQAVAERRTK